MSAKVDTWVCATCGTQNKPSWRFCSQCEAMPNGSTRTDLAPKPVRDPADSNVAGVVTIVVLATLVALAFIYRANLIDFLASLVG